MAATNGSAPGSTSDGAALPDNPNVIDDGNDNGIPISDGDGTPGNPRNPAASVKRGRGRPRLDGSSGPRSDSGSEKGTGGSQGKPKGGAKLDVDLFATQLVGVHKMLAAVTKNPLLEISEKEAKSLAESLKNVMLYHSINISPSTMAYIQLLGVCFAVYGPRVAMILAAKKAERDAMRNTFDAGTGEPVV